MGEKIWFFLHVFSLNSKSKQIWTNLSLEFLNCGTEIELGTTGSTCSVGRKKINDIKSLSKSQDYFKCIILQDIWSLPTAITPRGIPPSLARPTTTVGAQGWRISSQDPESNSPSSPSVPVMRKRGSRFPFLNKKLDSS